MDPKPFRCTYDPELSKSKSRGKKPVFTRARLDKSSGDPRLSQSGSRYGKRVVPSAALPPPDFARDYWRKNPRRCLLTGISPLVSRTRLLDVMRQFGSVQECRIVISETTGASLGIGWVLFGSSEARAAHKLMETGAQGALGLETDGDLIVRLDTDGSLMASVQKEKEDSLRSSFEELRAAELRANTRAREEAEAEYLAKDLQIVELRPLSVAQNTIWFNKFIGQEGTYVMIRDIFLSPRRHRAEHVADAFHAFPFKHIAVNRAGFYVCFDSPRDALDCYTKMHRRTILGTTIKLLATLKGRRYSSSEVLELARRRGDGTDGGINGHESEHSGFSDRQSSVRDQAAAIEEATTTLLVDVKNHVKKALWASVLSSFVSEIVQRELEKASNIKSLEAAAAGDDSRDASRDGVEDTSKDATPSSNGAPNTPTLSDATHSNEQLVGFGTRRGGSVGMTARALPGYGIVRPLTHLPGLKIRKRMSTAPAASSPVAKRRKALQVTAPNSYIRAPIDATLRSEEPDEPSVVKPGGGKDEHDTQHHIRKFAARGAHARGSDARESDSDIMREGSASAGEEADEEATGEDRARIQHPTGEALLAGEHDVSDSMEGLEEDSSEVETDEEERGMNLASCEVSTSIHPPLDFGYRDIQRLVRTQDDLLALKTELRKHMIPKATDAEIYDMLLNEYHPKQLADGTIGWPRSSVVVPFRSAPYRDISDDERREYLPNLGPGVPNEIVQSYKERPLYEGPDEIEEELRTDTRALNVSRAAFGANADLFADDNLSKNAKETRLARSAIHDWGLYANEIIPANDFVIEYVGDILRDEYAEIRERHYALEGIDSTYLFRLDNGTVIDATKRGNGARFINHSCDPNCIAQVFDYEGYKRVVLFSLRDIEIDEELTFDYNFVRSQDEDGKVRCACGATNCRGWLM